MRSFWPTAILIITTLPCALQAKTLQKAAVAITNMSNYERTDRVEVDSPFDVEKTHGVIVSDGERTFTGQVVGDRITFVAREIPAKACRLFWVTPTGRRGAGRVSSGRLKLENDYIRVAIDEKTGAIAGLYSKLAGRQFVPKGNLACAVETSRGGNPEPARLQQIDLVESGPTRATIRIEWAYGTSRIVQDMVLYESVARLDVNVTVDWQEGPDAELKIALPAAVREAKAWTGPAVGNNGSAWIDLSGQKEGITVIGDGRFPITCEGNVINLAVAPALSPASGLIELNYSLFPHPGGFNPSLTEEVVDSAFTPLRGAVALSPGN